MKKIYISGPMTGLLDLNFPAFHAETMRLRSLGYGVAHRVGMEIVIAKEIKA